LAKEPHNNNIFKEIVTRKQICSSGRKSQGGRRGKKSYKNIIIEGIEIERKTIKKFILQQQESTPFKKFRLQ